MATDIETYRARIGLFHRGKTVKFCLVCPILAGCLALRGILVAVILLLLLLTSGDIELNPGPPSNNRNISIWHSNIRSLNQSKVLALKADIANEFDIIALTETFLNNHDLDLQGYHPIYRKDRQNRDGGGIAAYISDTLIVTRKNNFELDSLEAMWLELRSSVSTFLLCVCYRPPDSGVVFWENLQESLDLALQAGHRNIFITGDLNADPRTDHGNRLRFFSVSNNLHIHVDEPTRITETTATILDQFISSDSMHDAVQDIEILCPLANCDHSPVLATLRFVNKKSKSFSRLIWKYDQADFNGFRNALNNYDWDTCFDNPDVNITASKWTESFLNIARQFIPNTFATIRPWDKPWYTNELRCLRRRRDRSHNIAKRTQHPDNWQRYREIRNQYVHSLEEAQTEYDMRQANKLRSDSFISPKRWWNITKSLLGFTKNSNIPTLIRSDNSLANDDKAKASTLNEFFLTNSTIDTTNARLPQPNLLTQNSLDTIQLNDDDVLQLLNSVDTSKATGPDNISPKMLKEAAPSIARPLTRLFNLSLSTCVFPDIWKQANVIPLYKKGNKSIPNNYRPISLLSIVGKILEKAVFKHTFNHIRDNELFTRFQSGFMPSDSTVNQLVHLYHVFCEALDQKKKVRIVFCDISKAFDRVWHEGLLYKLSNMGIKGTLHNWFSNYLHGRQQRVVIKGSSSEWGYINAGVPQGSVLGPLLFLVYINDITAAIRSNVSLFADDTCLYMNSTDHQNNATALNRDLEALESWAKQWLVTFSPEKTKSMNLSLNPQHTGNIPPLYFNQSQLEEVNHHKHLGLHLSENLKWNYHINSIVEKAAKRIGILNLLRFKLDRKTLETIYIAFIRPILEYGDVVFDNCSAECKELLESLQKRSGKIITGAIRGTPSDILYKELGWRPLQDRRTDHKTLLFSRITHNNAPSYLTDHLPAVVHQRTRYNLRNQDNITTFRSRTSIFSESFFPYMTRFWNNIDDNIKQTADPKSLRRQLNPRDTQRSQYYLLGPRKFQIIMSRLRMLCSDLSSHLHQMHIIENPYCPCGAAETTEHFFLDCPLYLHSRNILRNQLQNININLTLDIILNGVPNNNNDNDTNKRIVIAVNEYLCATNRFPLLN